MTARDEIVSRKIETDCAMAAAERKRMVETTADLAATLAYDDGVSDAVRGIMRWNRPWDRISLRDKLRELLRGEEDFGDPELDAKE